jgi:hypothetical protein
MRPAAIKRGALLAVYERNIWKWQDSATEGASHGVGRPRSEAHGGKTRLEDSEKKMQRRAAFRQLLATSPAASQLSGWSTIHRHCLTVRVY